MENLTTIPTTAPTNKVAIELSIHDFLKENYASYRGEPLNIIKDLQEVGVITGAEENLYGANVTVSYICPEFKDISFFPSDGKIPIMNIGNYDYLIAEITMPPAGDDWYDSHNLLHFTPYFYSSMKQGVNYTIFGSVDDSIFFTKKDLEPGSKIKICVTASKLVADYFESLPEKYFISRIPADYNQLTNESTFNIALRLGSPQDIKVNNDLFVQKNVSFEYHKFLYHSSSQPTFTSTEIQKVSQPAGPAPVFSRLSNRYKKLKAVMDTARENLGFGLAPYLANYASPPVDYAIKTFYQSIALSTPQNAQADNTQENYFMSDPIMVNDYREEYLHILYANQNKLGAALTSNVQIYDNDQGGHSCIKLDPDGFLKGQGLLLTAADLPTFSTKNYPYSDGSESDFAPYGICSIPFSAIQEFNTGIKGIIVVERFSYNPVTLNYTDYDLCHTSKAYVGPALNNELVEYLTANFEGIDLTNATIAST